MNLEELKDRLRKYKEEDIIITPHAEIRAYIRDIDLEEVKNNITNPDKLVYAREQPAEKKGEEKYECYFAYSDNFCHKYVIVINRKVIIVTIISINRKWQGMVK